MTEHEITDWVNEVINQPINSQWTIEENWHENESFFYKYFSSSFFKVTFPKFPNGQNARLAWIICHMNFRQDFSKKAP